MKCLFVARLSAPSGSGRQRLWALQKAGVEVHAINTDSFNPRHRILSLYCGRILRRPHLLVRAAAFETALQNACKTLQPDMLWFEWPREVRARCLSEIRTYPRRPLMVSFQDDNPWGDRHRDVWLWREYINNVRHFDVHIVKRQSDIENLSRIGPGVSILWEHGVYTPLFYPKACDKRYPLTFIGNCMDDRAATIREMLRRNIPIHVFGPRWSQRSNLPKLYPQNFHPAVEGEVYADVIRASYVCLGLVSWSNRDEWTMRTFEIPGCATALLAQRTGTHVRLFNDRSEAVLFSSVDEACEAAAQMLRRLDWCLELGGAGRRRLLDDGWALDRRMAMLVSNLAKLTVRRR